MAPSLAAVFTLFCISSASAQTLTNTFGSLSENSNEPIDIESDLLTIYPEQHATFSGNVKAVQGTTTLRARELKVNYLGGDKGTVGATQQVASEEPSANNASDGKPAANEGNGRGSAVSNGSSAQPGANVKGGGKPASSTQRSEASSARSVESTSLINDQIKIESDWLLINDKEKYAQFKGNVKVMQGTTKLRAGELTVSYAGGDSPSANAQMVSSKRPAAQITKMEAKGDVRALLTPTGATEPKSPGASLAETKVGQKPPQSTTPDGGKFDLAHANNKASGTTQTASGSEKSEPASASNGTADATAQSTTPTSNTASITTDESERNKNGEITKIEATGDVVITSDKNETTSSDWAVYDLPLQLVTIGGNVLLTQNENVLKGERLVIDLNTGESRFENAGNDSAGGGRIRALFMPKGSKSEAGDKSDAAAREPRREATPGQTGPETTFESPEPLQIVPEYR